MVAAGPTEPARLPPSDLHALNPEWSRLVRAHCTDGERDFHVLDSQPDASSAVPTLLCVHGNPSWSYLWRNVMPAPTSQDLAAPYRVVAVDHLDMGYSERTGTFRRLEDRIADLGALTEAMGITGRVITLAHDWGGPISLGWALAHREQLDGVILLNTAVHQPEDAPAPSVIRAARSGPALKRVTVDSTAFISGALELSRPRLAKEVRRGFLAPYSTPERRNAIKHFVEDIPMEPDHPTGPVLDDIADRLSELTEIPSLLLWGAKDPVFSDRYLRDLEIRLPHADVHRWPKATHFVSEDEPDVVNAIELWLQGHSGWRSSAASPAMPQAPPTPLSNEPSTLLDAIADPGRADSIAVKEMSGPGASITFGELHQRIEATAAGLHAHGIQAGERVAVMIPPGIDLVVAVYATWRAGAIGVLVDGALTPPQMTAALRSANPDWLIGIPRALTAARALRWPGKPIAAAPQSSARHRAMGSKTDLTTLRQQGGEPPAMPRSSDQAGVVFTSGSTGPSKGVRYSHGQLAAQRDAIASLYGIDQTDRLVAAFAPFALYGPMLGISSVVPDMDVSAPASLTADALAKAVAAIDATMVFGSPAALENILRTENELTANDRQPLEKVRILLSAGAPVRVPLLQAMRSVLPNAVAHTPYGMTEVLPVASISLPELEEIGPGDGVCVGFPVPGVDVDLLALEDQPENNLLGEITVRAPHMRTGYDRLWYTTARAGRPDTSWHATGDVGHRDAAGRLWVSGRAAHVIETIDSDGAKSFLGPVGVEKAVEDVDGVYLAAAVGVGSGEAPSRAVAVIVQLDQPSNRAGFAGLELTDTIRAAVAGWADTVRNVDQTATAHGVADDVDVVAVIEVPKLPVDRRHNSKIDRTRVSAWADKVLAGGRVGKL